MDPSEIERTYKLSLGFRNYITIQTGNLSYRDQFKSSNLGFRNNNKILFKDIDYCTIEIFKGLTDKGQFQYLAKLTGPQEGTYLYATQFHSLR